MKALIIDPESGERYQLFGREAEIALWLARSHPLADVVVGRLTCNWGQGDGTLKAEVARHHQHVGRKSGGRE